MTNSFEKRLGSGHRVEAGRSSHYAELLDPEHTLPSVILEVVGEDSIEGETFHSFEITNDEGMKVGDINLVVHDETNQAEIDLIELDGEFTKKGYGRASYLALIEQLTRTGVHLRSGNSLSREAKSIWDWMVERGAAKKVAEGNTDETVGRFGYSTAAYEVI